MADFLCGLPMFAVILSIGTYLFGLWCQQKTKSALCNPILISTLLTIGILLLVGIPNETYQAGMTRLSWLLTPATVCLALPLYRQVQKLKQNLPAILAGVAAGTITSLVFVFILCKAFSLSDAITVSLLPKSITTAMGSVLSANCGGIEALTAAAIIITGILGNLAGSLLCKIFKLTDPIAQGVAFGTASHVVGTTRANELGPIQGAVSSLSLAVAGVLTAVLFPLALIFL